MSELKRENRRYFFVYAPPLKGVRPSKRIAPQMPFRDAKPWQCSVYYYWWEYLRRHKGYRRTCEQGGKGRYAKLYADFGDVHDGEFWDWWRKHDFLFGEPRSRHVEQVTGANIHFDKDDNSILIRVPLENRLSFSMMQIKRLLKPMTAATHRRKTVSRAPYPVASKPVLSSLHQHLMVWDAKQANPKVHDADIADLAKVYVNTVVDGLFRYSKGSDDSDAKAIALTAEQEEHVIRRRKQLAVQRHLRIAEQYIANVARGKFPLRDGR